jgi:hypothetical protein
MTVIGIVAAFALVYPRLCAWAGFNPDSPDALNEIAKVIGPMNEAPALARVVRILYYLFLAMGPTAAMVLTLLYVTWVSTFTEFDPRTKDPMTFPARRFTLPVSTPFLFWWHFLAGMTSIVVLYASWIYGVRIPSVETFAVYKNCLGWITLLAVAQGIVWSLAAWPVIRMLVLTAALFAFLFSPAQVQFFKSPMVLPPLFLMGAVFARAGLQKMRHGQWQGRALEWMFPTQTATGKLHGPKRFASPAQAQLWFEWRRFARPLCFYAAALAVVPVVVHLMVRFVAGLGPLQDATLFGGIMALVAIPPFVHFFFALSPTRTDPPFLMIRPLTNGSMTMAALKAAALSTVISWLLVCAMLGAMPWLGDVHAAFRKMPVLPGVLAAMLTGLIFLTWRFVAVNLCIVWFGKRWMTGLQVLGIYAGGFMIPILSQNDAYANSLLRILPGLLVGLLTLKFLLAFLSFRLSLKRRLLAPSALVAYLVVWGLLAASLLAILFFVARPPRELILPASLGIVLLVPLARVGFCPLALARSRHT